MIRIFALLTLLMALTGVSVMASDLKNDPCNYPGYKEGACPPSQDKDQDYKIPGKPGDGDLPGHPGHPGYDNPGYGYPGNGPINDLCCGGLFEGYYYGQPFPVAFMLQGSAYGQLNAQSWFRGGSWYGQGVCRQMNAYQASFELYFPGAPIHRGVISRNQFGAIIMDGQLDFHGPFQLQRTR